MTPEQIQALREKRAALKREISEREAEIRAIDAELRRHQIETFDRCLTRVRPARENPTAPALPRGDRDEDETT
jgi:hypothetical protein